MWMMKCSSNWNLNLKYINQAYLKWVKNSYPGVCLNCCFQLGKTSGCQNHIKARFISPKFSFTRLVQTLSIFFSFLIIHSLILITITLNTKTTDFKWNFTEKAMLQLLAVYIDPRHVYSKLEAEIVWNTLHCFKTSLWFNILYRKQIQKWLRTLSVGHALNCRYTDSDYKPSH